MRQSPKKSDDEMDIEQNPEPPEEEKPVVLTDKEMNELNAKILKAEMLGDTVC